MKNRFFAFNLFFIKPLGIILLLLLLNIGTTQNLKAVEVDSNATNSIQTEKSVQELQDLIAKANAIVKETVKGKVHDAKELNAFQKFLVVLPLILLGLFIWWLILRLNKEGFKLTDALSGDNPMTMDVPNPSKDPEIVAQTPMVSVTQFPKSTSRLIAFMSGIVSIVIVICLICFFIYSFLSSGTVPDMSQLTNVFLPLGIGAVPYTVKQFSNKK